MPEQPGQAIDPVCGMAIDTEQAAARDLVAEHEGIAYYSCGRGCKLEFEEDPGRYLDPSYQASM